MGMILSMITDLLAIVGGMCILTGIFQYIRGLVNDNPGIKSEGAHSTVFGVIATCISWILPSILSVMTSTLFSDDMLITEPIVETTSTVASETAPLDIGMIIVGVFSALVLTSLVGMYMFSNTTDKSSESTVDVNTPTVSNEEQIAELIKEVAQCNLPELTKRLQTLLSVMKSTTKDDAILGSSISTIVSGIRQLVQATHRIGVRAVMETKAYHEALVLIDNIIKAINEEINAEAQLDLDDATSSIHAVNSVLQSKGYLNEKLYR